MASNALRFGILVPFLVLVVALGCCFWFASRGRTYVIPPVDQRWRNVTSAAGEVPQLIEMWASQTEGAGPWEGFVKVRRSYILGEYFASHMTLPLMEPVCGERVDMSASPMGAVEPSPLSVRSLRRKEKAVEKVSEHETSCPSPIYLQLALLIAMPCKGARLPTDKLSSYLPLSERLGGAVELGIIRTTFDAEDLYGQ